MIAYPELETAICSATQERLNPTGFNVVLTCSVPSSEPVSLLDSQKYRRCGRAVQLQYHHDGSRRLLVMLPRYVVSESEAASKIDIGV